MSSQDLTIPLTADGDVDVTALRERVARISDEVHRREVERMKQVGPEALADQVIAHRGY
jgi:hypothetical protein